jgi:hypothetical protein
MYFTFTGKRLLDAIDHRVAQYDEDLMLTEAYQEHIKRSKRKKMDCHTDENALFVMGDIPAGWQDFGKNHILNDNRRKEQDATIEQLRLARIFIKPTETYELHYTQLTLFGLNY